MSIGVFSQGVQALHQSGIVHTDLKLENVMMVDGNRPIILDFDISLTKDDMMRRTIASSVKSSFGDL